MSSSSPIAITMGDAAGVGPEITARTFADPDFAVAAFVIGDKAIIARAIKVLGVGLRVEEVTGPEGVAREPGVVPVLHVPGLDRDVPFGHIDEAAGRAAATCIRRAVELALAGRIRAVVTSPIHKEAFRLAGERYAGHTDMLADLAGAREHAMMLLNDELRVVLASVHIPLSRVPGSLSLERELGVIRLAAGAARRLGIASPRVAVAGLNPHAGEGGLFGDEEQRIIAPAIERATAEGIQASGPWSGDTVFMRARRGEFDIVVAQYHDQGLIPVKYLGLEEGVNVTLGLPFIRTSPDHGTAFDIAGTGRADHRSQRRAVELAERMSTAPL